MRSSSIVTAKIDQSVESRGNRTAGGKLPLIGDAGSARGTAHREILVGLLPGVEAFEPETRWRWRRRASAFGHADQSLALRLVRFELVRPLVINADLREAGFGNPVPILEAGDQVAFLCRMRVNVSGGGVPRTLEVPPEPRQHFAPRMTPVRFQSD